MIVNIYNHPLCVHLTLSFTLVLSPWSFYWFTYSSHCCRLVWEGRQTPKVAGVVYKRWWRLRRPLKISTKVVEFAQEENLISFCLQIFYSVSQEGRVKEGLGSKRGDHKVGTCKHIILLIIILQLARIIDFCVIFTLLSAGVVGSPKLLLLSGIGPRQDLARLGIPLVSFIIIILTLKTFRNISLNAYPHILTVISTFPGEFRSSY